MVTADTLRTFAPRIDNADLHAAVLEAARLGSSVTTPRRLCHFMGQVFVETGNLADLDLREQFPGELGVPDHLVFAGERQLRGFLHEAGFEVLRMEQARVDGIEHFAKSVVKKALGRPEHLRVPYTSRYRQLMVRARLTG